MDKPITVARVEFAESVVKAARDSRLPAFILADILKDLRDRLDTEAAQQYQSDKAAWDAQQKEAEDE